MTVRDEEVGVPVDGERLPGTLVTPGRRMPGMLFIQGWGSSQQQYLPRAREIAALGCACLTFEPRGVAKEDPRHQTVTREQNLQDTLAAYDLLAGQRGVDREMIGVVGSSYGGYMAALLSEHRPIRWLALRVPALYKDEDWAVPKAQLDRAALKAYRRTEISAENNRALAACARFGGDVLVVESEHDDTVPPPTVANYRKAFEAARSVTYRVIQGADHGLSEEPWQQAYTSLLVNWAREMVLGAREGGAAPAVQTHISPAPQRGAPAPA